MKLLMFHTEEFWYKTYSKTLADVPVDEREDKVGEGIVVFSHLAISWSSKSTS